MQQKAHTQHNRKQRFSVFAHHLCVLDRWVNTKVVFFLLKMPLLGLSVFYSPYVFHSFSLSWGGHSPSLTWQLSGCSQGHMFTHTDSGTWLNGLFFLNRGNYHSLAWLLEQSSKSQQPGCKTGARCMCFSQLQLYYLNYKWEVQEMKNADGDQFMCSIGLD